MIGSSGVSEASTIDSHGTPKASMGEWSRLILLPNASRRARGLMGSIIRPAYRWLAEPKATEPHRVATPARSQHSRSLPDC